MSAIERGWARVKALLFDVGRVITDVDRWDGSASNYPDTASYCAACLLDTNAAAGRTEKDQAHCMLPVREAGDSADTYVRQAIYAAAGGRGISAVKRPDDVPEAAWAAAVKAAANTIIAAYGEMDAVAPEAVYELAGKPPPEGAERGITLNSILGQVYAALGEDAWIIDLYFEDDGAPAVIYDSGGKVYKAPVVVTDGIATVGEALEVQVKYNPLGRALQGEPRSRSRLNLRQQTDGKWRWVAIAGTSVLLRAPAEIDSRELYDDFIANIPAYGYPQLRFFHDSRLVFGRSDWAVRDGNCLVASGLLDDGELAQGLVGSVQRGDVDWGISVGFMPTVEPELWEAANGVTIPVNKRGVWTELSVLPENRAAAHFTSIATVEVTRMRTEVLEALKKLMGDEAKALEIANQVDATNREIEEQGLVTRVEGVATPETAQAQTVQVTEYQPVDVEAIIARVRESLPQPPVMHDMAPIESALLELKRTVTALLAEVAALKRNDDEKRQTWLADLPARREIVVTHRPREANAPDPGKRSLADIANQTLSQIG